LKLELNSSDIILAHIQMYDLTTSPGGRSLSL